MRNTPFLQMTALLLAVSGISSYILCWIMRTVAPKINYVDHPGGRKAHTSPTPYGGGVAIVITFFSLILLGMILIITHHISSLQNFSWTEIHQSGISRRANQMGGILLGGFILFLLGLFDDVKNLGPFFKLIIQFLVAGLVVIGFDVRLSLFIHGVSFSWPASIFWIVVITNAFNFLDNADGLSSGIALICTLVLLAVAATGGQVLVSAYLACLAGALAGFLFHNFPPAKIFLGDAGSLLTGYLLAIGSLLTTYYYEAQPDTKAISVLIPLVVMAIPLYDFLSVIIIRHRLGLSPFVGDHRHFSHRLIKRGLSKRQMVLTIYLATACTAVSAVLLRYSTKITAILIFLQVICIVAIIGILEATGKMKADESHS
jgi:UDP-GlcNAc:undecaprenyl-phosphate GlcNAc-1-phosphate transferase